MTHLSTRMALTATIVVICALSFSCSEEKKARIVATNNTSDYKNLTENWHVLHNLELAYVNRDIVRYRELIDIDEFVFFFAPAEPEGNWPREVDDAATEKMFSGEVSNDPHYGRVVDINLELDSDGAQWVQVIEPGFESETWQETVANYIYDFSVEPGFNFINGSDAKAVFTVRRVMDTADNRMEWRLVRWRDLGFSNVLTVDGEDPTERSADALYTWGMLKSLYL